MHSRQLTKREVQHLKTHTMVKSQKVGDDCSVCGLPMIACLRIYCKDQVCENSLKQQKMEVKGILQDEIEKVIISFMVTHNFKFEKNLIKEWSGGLAGDVLYV